jgi:Heparinase II/III-like protein/Heparinase II/III N-terminus
MRGFHKPFAASDVLALPEAWQLYLFGFAVPRLYLQAYYRTADQQYLAAARDFILSWIDFENSQWWSGNDLLWNEHALAARSQILIDFWHDYRHSSIFSLVAAQKILELATKIGRMLADPDLYVFWSNHGVMQNLQLMQLRLAFPSIVSFAGYGELAWQRLSTQLPHYINAEGAILEHSAEYQEYGVALLGPILRDAALLGISVPSEIASQYERAIAVYAMLRRPDGTLPRYGDTDSPIDNPGPSTAKLDARGNFSPIEPRPEWRPPAADLLLPETGIAVWWSGLAHWPAPEGSSQVVMTWSNFLTRVHKHADELSFYLWADGQDWWNAVGYPLYFPAQASTPEPWDGSNAPHLAGEPWLSDCHSTLLGYAVSTNLTAIDVQRQSADGFSVRRQVIQAGPDRWIVIDSFHDGQDREIRTVWSTDSNLSYVLETPGRRFRLLAPVGQGQLEVTFLGSPEPAVAIVHGSLRPFIGWTSRNHFAVPTDAFIVTQQSRDAWAINVSLLRRSGDAAEVQPAHLSEWQSPEDWVLSIPGSDGDVVLRRQGTSLTASFAGGKSDQVVLKRDDAAQSAQAVAAYKTDLAEYAALFGDSLPRRVRWSLRLIALLAIQQAVIFAAYRWYPVVLSALCLCFLAGWSIIGLWLHVFHPL